MDKKKIGKKKIISLILASLLIVSTAPMTAEACSENESTNVKINITNEEKQKLYEEINETGSDVVQKIRNQEHKLSKEHKSNLKQANYLSELESISSRAYYSYDGSKAGNYAAKYALSYNFSYSNYNGRGGDCTNFVSQCIYAGGIPTDATWKKDSNAWIRVTELRNWLVKKRYAKEFTWQSNGKEGDLVQLYNSSNGWYHSLIITYKRTDGQLFVSSHSADYYNRALANYTSKMRYLILTS